MQLNGGAVVDMATMHTEIDFSFFKVKLNGAECFVVIATIHLQWEIDCTLASK